MCITKVKKVAIVGPESTGKTTLAKSLAAHFRTTWVPEYAREYLAYLKRPYQETDLTHIALGQRAAEERLCGQARAVLLCDTTPLVIEIWSRVKYGRCAQKIIALSTSPTYDLYLLTYPDIPWSPDPLRENPHDREKLLIQYQSLLYQRGIAFVPIQGSENLRQTTAVRHITNLLEHGQPLKKA